MSRRLLATLGTASLFALSLAAAGVTPAAAAALTYNVNTTNDVAYTLPTVVCAPAPAPQVVPCSIRAAIQQANMAPAGTVTQVRVPAGTYQITIPRGCANDGDACGDFNVTSTVVLTGAGQVTTIIDANHLDRGFDVGAAGNLTMSGVTVENGLLSGEATCGIGRPQGGGIRVTGTMALSASTILNNHANYIGGGVAEDGNSPSSTTLDHVTIKGNTARLGAGATQTGQTSCLGGSGPFTGKLAINNSLVTGNVASSYTGGVDEDGGGTVTVTNSTVSKNSSHNAGGNGDIGGVAEDGGGSVTISNSTVDSNTTDSQAGGIVEDGGGTLKIDHSVVSNNTARDSAGGIYLDGGGKITMDHLEVFGNSVAGQSSQVTSFTGSGGGILEDGGDPTTMTDVYVHDNHGSHGAGMYLDGGGQFDIANLTVSNNSTALTKAGAGNDGYGGGILVDGGNKVNMINSTISGNTSASQGGGIITAPDSGNSRTQVLNLAFTTIANNTAATGGQNLQLVRFGQDPKPIVNLRATILSGTGANCGPLSPVSQGYNLDSGASCLLSQTGDQSGVDPKLAALTNNGGFEPTRALVVGSGAIDAVATGCPPPSLDQRGVARPQGSHCDVGAFEYLPPPPATPPATVTPPPGLPKAGSGQPGAGSERLALVALAFVAGSLALVWRKTAGST